VYPEQVESKNGLYSMEISVLMEENLLLLWSLKEKSLKKSTSRR